MKIYIFSVLLSTACGFVYLHMLRKDGQIKNLELLEYLLFLFCCFAVIIFPVFIIYEKNQKFADFVDHYVLGWME